MNSDNSTENYLKPGKFVDSDSPAVIAYTRRHTDEKATQTEKAKQLYYAIRDGFKYNPYLIDLRQEALKASYLITKDNGYCIEKANLLAATARAVGIPARLGFAQVRNHIGTARLEEILKSDLLVFHGYTELFLNNRWVKATPAFNLQLCKRLGIEPLEFDGENDSVFQEFLPSGGLYMEYVHDYGHFADIPYDMFLSELKKYYPHVFASEMYDSEKKLLKMT